MTNEHPRFQLVLQWPARGSGAYEKLITLETRVEAMLDPPAELDGHDMGSGEMNIFIHTDDPVGTFDAIRSLLDSEGLSADVKVAYRAFSEDEYSVLWPPTLTTFDVS